MKIYSTTLMIDHCNECKKNEADVLAMGAKPVDFEKDFPNVRAVFRAGVGCDNIDIEDLRRRGISLFFPKQRTRMIISNAVAEQTIRMILATDLLGVDVEMNWKERPARKSLKYKRVLVYGCGRVGGRVHGMLLGSEMCGDVAAYDIRSAPGSPRIEDMDIITFHVPLTYYDPGSYWTDNRMLINADFLSKCKPDATIINTSRGAIACEADIADWLAANPEARYATDVYSIEPYDPFTNPLKMFHGKQLLATPHMASFTQEVRGALTRDFEEVKSEIKAAVSSR